MEPEPTTARDHLANERTLLAWVRTSVTIVGLGFLIDRLAAQGNAGLIEQWAGVLLVLFGAVVAFAGAWSYLRARSDMATGSYRPAVGLNLAIILLVAVGALVVALFLVTTQPV